MTARLCKCRLGLIEWMLWPSFAQPVLFVLSFVYWNVFYCCVLTAQTWLDLTWLVQTLEAIDRCSRRLPMYLIRQWHLCRTGRLLLQPEINSDSGSYVKQGFCPIIVCDEVETDTWSKHRDLVFIRNSMTKTRDLQFEKEARDFNISAIAEFFWNVLITSVLNFFKFPVFFRHVLCDSLVLKEPNFHTFRTFHRALVTRNVHGTPRLINR